MRVYRGEQEDGRTRREMEGQNINKEKEKGAGCYIDFPTLSTLNAFTMKRT